jgi:hypothetical protein
MGLLPLLARLLGLQIGHLIMDRQVVPLPHQLPEWIGDQMLTFRCHLPLHNIIYRIDHRVPFRVCLRIVKVLDLIIQAAQNIFVIEARRIQEPRGVETALLIRHHVLADEKCLVNHLGIRGRCMTEIEVRHEILGLEMIYPRETGVMR